MYENIVLKDMNKFHVISIGCQMTNLVSNFEYLLLLCFFNGGQVLKFGAPSKYYKGVLTKKRWLILNELDLVLMSGEKKSKPTFKIRHQMTLSAHNSKFYQNRICMLRS